MKPLEMNRTEIESAIYIPITSEVTIQEGMVVKEIATDNYYGVERRIINREEVSGEPVWEIKNVEDENDRKVLRYLQLSAKYLAPELA